MLEDSIVNGNKNTKTKIQGKKTVQRAKKMRQKLYTK